MNALVSMACAEEWLESSKHPWVLPCSRVRMANTLAFLFSSKICLETAKALEKEGDLEQ